jgi:hypothetical protein
MVHGCFRRPILLSDNIEKVNETIFNNENQGNFDVHICSNFDYIMHYGVYFICCMILGIILGLCYSCFRYGGEINLSYKPIDLSDDNEEDEKINNV